jgi:hypothetical protein
MVYHHETGKNASLSPETPEDRQIDRLSDLGVTNMYGAVAQVYDLDPHRPVVRDIRAAKAAQAGRSHASRRGGRSFPEPSDSALDPNWNVTLDEPLGEADVIVNHTAIGMLRAILDAQKHDPEAAAKHAAHLEEVRVRADAELHRS